MDGLAAGATRRDLVRRALTVGIAGTGAGVLVPGLITAPADGAQPPQTDAQLVSTLLGAERLAVFVYTHCLHSGLLSGDREHMARRLLGHERAHVRAMESSASRLDAKPPAVLHSLADADKLLAASKVQGTLTALGSEADVIRLLVSLEVALERGYYGAMSTLDDTELQHTAAQILATEAQHATTLTELLFPGDVVKAVPEPFVEGNPGDARM